MSEWVLRKKPDGTENVPSEEGLYYIAVRKKSGPEYGYVVAEFFKRYFDSLVVVEGDKVLSDTTKKVDRPIFLAKEKVENVFNGSNIYFLQDVIAWHKLPEDLKVGA